MGMLSVLWAGNRMGQRWKKNLIAMIAITRYRTVMIDQFVAKMKQRYVTILNQCQRGKKNE